jgi:hypothetical protein
MKNSYDPANKKLLDGHNNFWLCPIHELNIYLFSFVILILKKNMNVASWF